MNVTNPLQQAAATVVHHSALIGSEEKEVDVHHRHHRHQQSSTSRRMKKILRGSVTILCTIVMTMMTIIVNTGSAIAFQQPSVRNYCPKASSACLHRQLVAPTIHSDSGSSSRCISHQSKSLQLQMMSNNNKYNDLLPGPLRTLRSPSSSIASNNDNDSTTSASPQPMQFQIQVETLTRILLPSFLSSLLAFFLFPQLSLGLSYLINDSATFAVLSVDSSQFIQNFLTVTGLTFSILVGQTYYFMYQQQEAVFVSLFGEVTEAKSLLEQVALVCQGRKDMYEMCLIAVKRYVEEDLKKGLGKEPARVLSARPMDDPLEIIMYLTRLVFFLLSLFVSFGVWYKSVCCF